MKGQTYLKRFQEYEQKIPGIIEMVRSSNRISISELCTKLGIPKKKLEADIYHFRKLELTDSSSCVQAGSFLVQRRTLIFGKVEKDLNHILSYCACEDRETLELIRSIFLKYAKDLNNIIEEKKVND